MPSRGRRSNRPKPDQLNGRGNLPKKDKILFTVGVLGRPMHIVNLDGRPYVPTEEIIRNYTYLNGSHVALAILDTCRVGISFLDLNRDLRPDIFEILDESEISHMTHDCQGVLKEKLHIMPLVSVPYFVHSLHCDSKELEAAVAEAQEKFREFYQTMSAY